MQQLIIGVITEGTTDWRFLESIIKRVFYEISFECHNVVEVYSINFINNLEELKFVDKVLEASKKGYQEFGITILCVQADADKKTLDETYKYKIEPAKEALRKQNKEEYCKTLVAIVPIQETESWMLADKELLKNQIGTTKRDTELGIHGNAEQTASPKEVIQEAIRIARQNATKRRRKELTISELYQSIGEAIDLEKLDTFKSYQDFKKNVREAYKELGLLY